jgi:hypothetical protein
MFEGARDFRRNNRGKFWLFSYGEIEQCLSRFARKMGGQVEDRILGCRSNIREPVLRNPIHQQLVIRILSKERRQDRLGRNQFCLDGPVHEYFLNALPHFDNLRSTSSRMGLNSSPFSPFICCVVVVNVANQKAVFRLVDDQTDVTAHPHRPEILVLGLVDAVELD